MNPVIIALICAASFGTVVAIAACIHQLFLSRDKLINDDAQRIALAQETGELERMREQMQSNKRFDAHYNILKDNKEVIVLLGNEIEEIFRKKTRLIERYNQLTIKASGAIIDGQLFQEDKEACDRLKAEIDKEIKFYEEELITLQKRRTDEWDTHGELQDYLLKQEQARNAGLDALYKQHSSLLEKVYLRHIENAEHVATATINASATSFKSVIMAPINFLLQYFNLSTGISLSQAQVEQSARDGVSQAEKDVNDTDNDQDKAPDSNIPAEPPVSQDNEQSMTV